MTSKKPAESGKPWKPGDPLRLDKALKQTPSDRLLTDKLDRADDALFTPGKSASRSVAPANNKAFNRQKKG